MANHSAFSSSARRRAARISFPLSGLGTHADQQPLARRPRAGDGLRLHVAAHLVVDPFGRTPERNLAQRGQVAQAKEFLDRPLRLRRHIDLAILQPLDQLGWRQVDQPNLGRLIENAVWDGLAHHDAGDLGNDVVEALQVLDIECGVDVDAGSQQILDVLVALGMARAGRVGVGQLVHQRQPRLPGQHRVHVHLAEDGAAVFNDAPREDVQPIEQCIRLGSAVGLDVAHDQIDALGSPLLGGLQHGIGLAHAGCVAKKDQQLAARGKLLFDLDSSQQLVRIASGYRVRHLEIIVARPAPSSTSAR